MISRDIGVSRRWSARRENLSISSLSLSLTHTYTHIHTLTPHFDTHIYVHRYADFAIAEAARTLGKTNDETRFRNRAKKAYQSVFDSRTKLMSPRSRNSGVQNQDGVKWGGAFTEGAPWHHTFSVAYDVDGLAELFGSKQNLLDALQKMMDTPSTFNHGSYGQDIHEMIEFRDAGMGQYAANNQPMHSVLYLFSAAGDRSRTEAWVRAAMEHVFGPDFYQGDEDNGEMGSWYVLSALGIFPLAPGTDRWILGSPLFRDVKIVYPKDLGRDSITILAENNSRDHVLVRSVKWRGQNHNDVYISHKELSRGGVFNFDMVSKSSAEKINLMPIEPAFADEDGGVVTATTRKKAHQQIPERSEVNTRSKPSPPPPPPSRRDLSSPSLPKSKPFSNLNLPRILKKEKPASVQNGHDSKSHNNINSEHTLELPEHNHDKEHDKEVKIQHPSSSSATPSSSSSYYATEDNGKMFRIASALGMMLTGIGILIVGVRKLSSSDYDAVAVPSSRRPRRKRVV